MKRTIICDMLGISYPIIQGGMAWVSEAPLAAAVSEAGGFGLLGSGTMTGDELLKQIRKVREQTSKPFGVNIVIMGEEPEKKVDICIKEKVNAVFTSAGNPKLFTQKLKENGIVVAHVVPSRRLAEKAKAAGVDIIVCESFEAGGHDGPDELTTMTLIPLVKKAAGETPVVAAGGIITGAQIAAALALGADGVQMGTRFLATNECNAHPRFKKGVLEATETGTLFVARRYKPQRILRNPFAEEIAQMDFGGKTAEEIRDKYGPNRGYKGSVEGNWEEGYFNCGQGAALVEDIKSVASLFESLISEYEVAKRRI